MSQVKFVECPRDAMQGLHDFIPTEEKVRYINQLLKVGYDVIDFGSFVSPKAIPQMRDTAEVLGNLDLASDRKTKLLAIVANLRGANDAANHEAIDYLGYPFSISETFQLRNTNSTILESLERVKQIREVCVASNKEMVLYISMGFGNPYGDEWNTEIVQRWVDELIPLGIHTFALSDTIGVATPESIEYLFSDLIPCYPEVTFGAHLHTQPHNWRERIHAAYESGCRRFDSAIKGFGGCPMAKDDLTGNMATENLLSYFQDIELELDLDMDAFAKSMKIASEVFPS